MTGILEVLVDYFLDIMSEKNMKHLHKIAFLLVIVGGLNWLLLGLFQWEIGALFGGSAAIISRIIYILVGLAAVYELVSHKKSCKECSMKGGGKMNTPGNAPMGGQGGMDH